MEVFLCVADYWRICPDRARLRYAFANACHAAWDRIPRVKVEVLSGKGIVFQRERRIEAERRATGEIYCVADDDCLIHAGAAAVDEARRQADRHPAFATLSATPQNANIRDWTPEEYTPQSDDAVQEHFSVGGIRFMRKGAMTEWPPLTGKHYDGTQCQWLREHGWRVGYLRGVTMLHLGEGQDVTTLG